MADRPTPRRFDRRRFLRYAGTGTAGLATSWLLPACGDDAGSDPQLVALFSPAGVLAAGIEQRIPFGLIDQGTPVRNATGRFPLRIRADGDVLVETEVEGRLVAHDHPAGDADEPHEHASLLRYFAVRTTLAEPGIYDLELDVDGRTATLAFQIFDRNEIAVPLPGEELPSVSFPTLADPLGVDPICTQFGGPCPLHAVTVDEALATGSPLALLVATPAYCATAYCGPVLDVLLELRPDFPNVSFLHAEVYENPTEVGGNLLDPGLRVSPTVSDLRLDFEPSLFLVGSDRRIVDRIDNVYDSEELRAALGSV